MTDTTPTRKQRMLNQGMDSLDYWVDTHAAPVDQQLQVSAIMEVAGVWWL